MVNKRRQTLATGLNRPLAQPTDSSAASSTTRKPGPRIPRSRKSMIPRVAGQENEVNQVSAPEPPKAKPPRKSMGPRPSQRKSLAPTPTKNRRVSLAPDSSHVTSDPRPKDRTYLLNSLRKMIAYLKQHGYDTSDLSASKLHSHGVSGRDFNKIMTFLLRRIDPTFNSPKTDQRTDEPPLKFEDEVTLAFKVLGYPLPISKTAIVAVGAPHSWPALIAAIDWLIDLLSIVEIESPHNWTDDPSADEELFSQEENMARATRQFDEFLRKSITAFYRDDNEMQEELENELLTVWIGDNERTDGYLEEMSGEVEGLRGEIGRLEGEIESLSEVHEKREGYAADIEKYLTLVSEMKQAYSESESKVSALKQEKNEIESSMEEISDNILKLKEVIGSQELTVDDVRKLERMKVRLEEQCGQKKVVLEGHVQALKEAEEKYGKCLELVNAAVEMYNSKARGLELVPEGARNSGGKRLEMKVNGEAETLEGLLSVSVENVTGHIKKVTDKYVKDTKEEKKRAMELKGRMEDLEVHNDELDQEIETIQDQIITRQEETNLEQEKLQSEIQSKQSQHQLLQSKATALNDPSSTETTIAKNEKRYKELQVEHKKQEAENIAKKKAVADEIRHAIEKSQEHELFIKETIAKRNAYVKEKKEEITKKLALPTETKGS